MKESTPQKKKKLSIRKISLKGLTVRSGVQAGRITPQPGVAPQTGRITPQP